ncbi:uncharacterized protein LOC131656430 [Vicia villosa]|uniref:uncharacterized protein LOC131656430 n=1 Tax=Vicia villosa TaxID=3911 RepID=UPI00273C4FF5|nr:uncharacterized protein LOC131656430 [Vicia villosa]
MAQFGSSATNRRAENSISLISSASQSGIEQLCLCGSKAAIRSVKKKGRNLGKLFWGCRYFKSEDDNPGCNFFLWYENQHSDEGKQEIQHAALSRCSKCDEKDLQLKMLRRDDNYNKDIMKNILKMMKMLFYVIICLVLIVVVLICMLFKEW